MQRASTWIAALLGQTGLVLVEIRGWPPCEQAIRWWFQNWIVWPDQFPMHAPSTMRWAKQGVKLQLGTIVHDPSDPMGKLFFKILPTFAEFEADLIRLRTREGMAIARAKGKLRGKKPKLSEHQQKELRRMHDTSEYSISDLAEVFSI